MEIKLGSKVKCLVTGFEGIATADVRYLSGCRQICVTPKSTDGKFPNHQYIDIQQLEIIDGGIDLPSKDTGGIMSNAPIR